ncbi:PREDICTED: helicase ARIP4-like [Amphimedon queenslandica]|uniref:Helicase ATP-binding domain-containing protein n=1 Tax=Amphimedon queenslandica TaxID=400682 RepID=A0A1X7VQJ1_AMPQE|nr:PREDICTED: helicase ARIP4-like [Amphimedon queenslandica]|eukprot:XP_019855376.1 PREDICTED: helicase ARIP4-like [Amphimedon queenslandica]
MENRVERSSLDIEEEGYIENEEEEEDGEEECDESESEEEQKGGEVCPDNGQKKRKRKRKSTKQPGHRRNIKSKYESIEDFNPEALMAQTEELERIKRLEQLQNQLDDQSLEQSCDQDNLLERKSPSNEVESPPVVMVDLTGDDDDDEIKEPASSSSSSSVNGDMVILEDISSAKKPRRVSEIHKKYEVAERREDGQVLINVGHPSGEGDVFLVPQITAIIKPHQVGGIRFMYDNIIESLEHYKSSTGFGCILAHAMGLGKTLQVIGFIDIFLRVTSAQRVLCVVPVNTLQNWSNEFDKWLPVKSDSDHDTKVVPRNFTLFMLTESIRSMESRYDIISRWYRMGGVLLMGYEMFRLLSLSIPSIGGNKMAVKRKKKVKSVGPTMIDLDETEREMDILIEIQQALCNPGPDMIVCDEGHRIKNDSTNISQALKRVKTRRRIVMTGYPLQNNLLEYWCMVDFVRPMYLGTKAEFMDLFERPISNGQCIDSTLKDVQLMKFRSHVLHELLKGFVLRRGHDVLREILPPKFEQVLLLRLSHVQQTLYDLNVTSNQSSTSSTSASMEAINKAFNLPSIPLPIPVSSSSTLGPLKAFAVCTKIWNHPDIYYDQSVNQKSSTNERLFDEDGLPQSITQCNLEWPHTSLPEYQTGVLENSPKMTVLSLLVDLSVAAGDKILIFSQSLPTLSFIEKLLSSRYMPVPSSITPEGSYLTSDQPWVKGKNFYRLDGSTGSVERDRLIGQFNSPSNQATWAFLLSTKAGCLGINLVGANRVIVVDVSWNPCYDSQAVCRVYRYGQVKPCYIYRLVTDLSMEKRMYDRQVTKQSMADRVVDELNPERHFTANEIFSLLAPMTDDTPYMDLSVHSDEFNYDFVLASLLKSHSKWLTKLPFKHESLLLDSEERLSDVEKYVAMKGFQQQLMAMRRVPTPAVPIHAHLQHQQATINTQQIPVQQNIQVPVQQQSVITQREGSADGPSKEVEVICLDSDSDSEFDNLVPTNEVSKLGLPVAVPPMIVRPLHTAGAPQQQNEGATCSQLAQNAAMSSLPSASVQPSQFLTIIPPQEQTKEDDTLSQYLSTGSMLPPVTEIQASFQNEASTFSIQPVQNAAPLQVEEANQDQHTPSEAAVAQALAGFIQFQRQLCKSFNTTKDGQSSSTDIINTLTNTLHQVQKQSLPSTPQAIATPTLTTPITTLDPLVSSSPSISQIGSVPLASVDSDIHSYISTLHQHTPFTSARKAAIVAPISHRPPAISSSVVTTVNTEGNSIHSSTSLSTETQLK